MRLETIFNKKNKTMKQVMKMVLMGLALILTATFATAQPHKGGKSGNPEEHAKKQTEHLKTSLDLTEAQTVKVQAINLKYAEKVKEMREEFRKARKAGDNDKAEMHEEGRKEMKALKEEHKKELKAVLTPEQAKKFDNLPKKKEGNPEEHAKKQTEHLKTVLNLTEAQTIKVGEVNAKYAKQVYAVKEEARKKHETGAVTDEKAAREEAKNKIKTLKTQQEKEVKEVLTPEQVKAFDAFLKERKEQKHEGKMHNKKK